MTAAAVALPKIPDRILVNGKAIKARLAQQVIFSYVITTLAVGAVAAGYFLLLQTNWHIGHHELFYLKAGWDGLFAASWWPVTRHALRNMGEAVLAALGVHALITKWQKHPYERLSGVRLVLRLAECLVYAFVLIVGGIYLLKFGGPQLWHKWFDNHTLQLHVHLTPWLSTFLSQYDVPTLILGFVIVYIIKWRWRPVGNTINLALLEGAVYRAKGRTPFWVKYPVMPPSVRERFSWLQQVTPVSALKPQSDIIVKILTWVVGVAFLLAIYGEYILHIIAPGHHH
jgi:hypothetical protein